MGVHPASSQVGAQNSSKPDEALQLAAGLAEAAVRQKMISGNCNIMMHASPVVGRHPHMAPTTAAVMTGICMCMGIIDGTLSA